MNQRRGQILAILSLVTTAGLPVLLLLMRLKIFTFRDDFTGLNAVGFALSWALALLVSGTLLGRLAEDHGVHNQVPHNNASQPTVVVGG
jgi:uncharacterized membrane protein